MREGGHFLALWSLLSFSFHLIFLCLFGLVFLTLALFSFKIFAYTERQRPAVWRTNGAGGECNSLDMLESRNFYQRKEEPSYTVRCREGTLSILTDDKAKNTHIWITDPRPWKEMTVEFSHFWFKNKINMKLPKLMKTIYLKSFSYNPIEGSSGGILLKVQMQTKM